MPFAVDAARGDIVGGVARGHEHAVADADPGGPQAARAPLDARLSLCVGVFDVVGDRATSGRRPRRPRPARATGSFSSRRAPAYGTGPRAPWHSPLGTFWPMAARTRGSIDSRTRPTATASRCSSCTVSREARSTGPMSSSRWRATGASSPSTIAVTARARTPAMRPTYTFDQLVADMTRLVDRLGLERFDLLGHSMGGVVAMRYTLRHPGARAFARSSWTPPRARSRAPPICCAAASSSCARRACARSTT